MTEEAALKTWIKDILLSNDDITAVTSVNTVGNTGKGEGYNGDIVFANATVTTTQKPQRLDLVLKCSQPHPKTAFSVRNLFDQEIKVYEAILPALVAFQASKTTEKSFDNMVKYHGSISTETQDILALENLKRSGYEVADRMQALDENHLEMVLKAYGELHALSAAVKDQKPDVLETLEWKKHEEGMQNIMRNFQVATMVLTNLQATLDQFKGVLEQPVLDKWRKLQDQAEYITFEMRTKAGPMKVFTHGDCWINNFMFKYDENRKLQLVNILDWQLSGYTSPIMDLSYFLFVSIENLDDVDRLLDVYHAAFSDALRAVGSDPDKVYSKTQFLDDWRKYARYGITMAPVATKVQLCEPDEAPDMHDGESERADKLSFQLKDNAKYLSRMKNLIQYAATKGLID